MPIFETRLFETNGGPDTKPDALHRLRQINDTVSQKRGLIRGWDRLALPTVRRRVASDRSRQSPAPLGKKAKRVMR
jgi:hypothetical protein